MRAINSLFGCLLACSLPAASQNVMTSSPYSMFGVGEITSGLYGAQAAMGGTSYGLRESTSVNLENPAALTALDTCRLFAEVSAFIRGEAYRSGGKSNRTFTGNASAFSLAGRLMPGWYAAASVTPYSVVGYSFHSDQPLEGAPEATYTSTFQGSGGLSKATLSQAVRWSPAFSIGVNLSYVFGSIVRKESQEGMSVSRETHAQTFYADFGVQYTRRFRSDLALIVGAVYGYRQKLKGKNTVTVTGDYADEASRLKTDLQYLPRFGGIGGALRYKKWTYALDYTFRQYGCLHSGESRIAFRNAHEVRAGLCYFPDGFASGSYWRRVSYKGGVNLSTPYLSENKRSGVGLRISLGLGFPVLNGRVHVAAFHDRVQWEGSTFRRQVTGMTVTYTISERFYQVKL